MEESSTRHFGIEGIGSAIAVCGFCATGLQPSISVMQGANRFFSPQIYEDAAAYGLRPTFLTRVPNLILRTSSIKSNHHA